MEQKQQVNVSFESFFKKMLDDYKMDLKRLLKNRLNDNQITHQFYLEINEEITDMFINLNNNLSGILKSSDKRIKVLEQMVGGKK